MAWAAVIGALISAGGSYASSRSAGSGSGGEPDFKLTPEYPEAMGARSSWWDTLQKWGQDPNYGAISPDWNDIWDRTKNKISQYYWGGANSPGLADKIRSSAARRNVAGGPAEDVMMARMGAEESGKLKDIATAQNTERASLSENARNTWLQSLMGLSAQRPGYVAYNDNEVIGSPVGSAMSAIGSGVSAYAQNKSQQDWLSNLYKQQGGAGGGSTDVGTSKLYDSIQGSDTVPELGSGYYSSDRAFGVADPFAGKNWSLENGYQ